MKNIVLIGLMGSGKTTVGEALAQKLGYEFLDTDKVIEQELNMTINEIFKTKGENYFRSLEVDIVKTFENLSNMVISTGGGIVKNHKNLKRLKKNGVVFYLKATAETLFNRVKEQKNRPLLNNEAPLYALQKLLKEREGEYKKANITIETDKKSVDEIVLEIFKNYNDKFNQAERLFLP
jgi:shikimate kinase